MVSQSSDLNAPRVFAAARQAPRGGLLLRESDAQNLASAVELKRVCVAYTASFATKCHHWRPVSAI